jgi:hypothetical protein
MCSRGFLNKKRRKRDYRKQRKHSVKCDCRFQFLGGRSSYRKRAHILIGYEIRIGYSYFGSQS